MRINIGDYITLAVSDYVPSAYRKDKYKVIEFSHKDAFVIIDISKTPDVCATWYVPLRMITSVSKLGKHTYKNFTWG